MPPAGQPSDMPRPPLVTDHLEGETVETTVNLGGGDTVYCTPTRTLLYRADGLLSDESVQEFPHDVDRVGLEEGRRKSTIRLIDPEQTREFAVPAGHTDAVLEGVLGGILRATETIEQAEQVLGVFRFSELTLVLTDARVLKHVGSHVWGPDAENYPFAAATDISAEEGTHAVQLILEIDGRPQRVKIPADRAATVRRRIQEALFGYHDVDSLEEFREVVGAADAADSHPAGTDDGASTGDTATAGSEHEAVSSFDLEGSPGTDTTGTDVDVERRLAALEEAIQNQSELLERQQDVLEQLVEELRRGR